MFTIYRIQRSRWTGLRTPTKVRRRPSRSCPGDAALRLRLVQAPPHVGPQCAADILVSLREVELVGVEVAAAPLLCVGVCRIVRVGHHCQEVLVAAKASHVLGWPSAGTCRAGRRTGGRVQG